MMGTAGAIQLFTMHCSQSQFAGQLVSSSYVGLVGLGYCSLIKATDQTTALGAMLIACADASD